MTCLICDSYEHNTEFCPYGTGLEDDNTGDHIRCVICGEPCDGRGGGTAEMYDTRAEQDLVNRGIAAGIVHADCGLTRGWEVS